MHLSGSLGAVIEGTGSLGYDLKGTQLDGGTLHTEIQTSQVGSSSFFRVSVNRSCLFTGPEPPGVMAFTLLESGHCTTNGVDVATQRLSSYAAKELHVVHVGGALRSHLCEQQLRRRLEESKAHKALEALETTAGIQLNRLQMQDYRRLHQGALVQRLEESQFIDFMTTVLEQDAEPCNEPRNLPLLRSMVKLAHREADGAPLSLPEICRLLNVGKTTLSEHCRQTYGMGVMHFFRQVRLEQVRLALLQPGRVSSIEQIRLRYRFSNRARFASAYKQAFGLLPSETHPL